MDAKQNMTLLEEMDNLLRMIFQKYQQYFLPENSELSPHQIYFLKFLERRKTCTPSDIALEFGITLGAVTGFVDRLYKFGLISRNRSEEDRRVVLIELTPKGHEELRMFDAQKEEKFARLFEKTGEVQLKEINKSLDSLKNVLVDLNHSKCLR